MTVSAVMAAGAMKWAARLALFTLVIQVSALGHWSLGPVRAGADADFAAHAAHCHGNVAGCAGESSFAGTYIERPLGLPSSAIVLTMRELPAPAPVGLSPAAPDYPPRSL
jgi:hypothetical protein